MEFQETAKILIITDDTVVQSLYSAILAGYSLRHSDFTESFTQTLNFAPDVVVLHFDDHYQANIAEFLVKLRQTYNQNDRPLTLLIVPKDWFDQQLKNLADMYLTALVAPDHLLEAIENLFQQKLS